MTLKVIFFGTPQFAATVLEKMIASKIHLIAVVTKENKKTGRFLKEKPSPVKEIADKNKILCLQPFKASDPNFLKELEALKADVFVVAAYSEILTQQLLDLPRLECINVHASLLPKYRGAAPIHYAILNGEKETGITIMKVIKQLDAGPILAMQKISISEEDTTGVIQEKLSHLGASLLIESLKAFDKGTVTMEPQDDNQSTYAGKITSEMAQISWDSSIEIIFNQIRAFTPKPGAWCEVLVRGEKKRLLIKKAKKTLEKSPGPGKFISKSKFIIGCKDFCIHLQEIQLQGKKAMTDQAFLCGAQPLEMINK